MWSDIIAQDYDYFENWARIGAGNKFIAFSLNECHQRNCITAEDTVMMMWSSAAREDRFINKEWYTPGPVYNSGYDEDFIKRFTDTTGYLLDTVNYIQSSENLLNNIGCQTQFFSTLPLDVSTDWFSKLVQKVNPGVSQEIFKLYSQTLSKIKPSVFETIWNCDWSSREHVIAQRNTHDAYDILYKNYTDNATENWPSFDDFYNDEMQGVKSFILKEIDKQFNFNNARDKVKGLKRADLHLTPLENLEYLQKLSIRVSKEAVQFAEHWDKIVMTGQGKQWKPKSTHRQF